MSNLAFEISWVIFMLIVYLIYGWVAGSHTTPEQAIRAAELYSYSDIRVTDKKIMFMEFRGCGVGDDSLFTLTAKNQKGEEKTFYVCAAWLFKGATIRAM